MPTRSSGTCTRNSGNSVGWAPHTVVVILRDGPEWIWNRANMFVRRCEILDFWHALEHAWTFARLRYGEGSVQADTWVHQIAEDLRSGKVEDVIGRLKRLRPRTAELRDSLQALIRYYSENAGRMRYDESVQRMTQATLEEPSVVRTQLTPAVSEYTTRLCRANRLTALAISARST